MESDELESEGARVLTAIGGAVGTAAVCNAIRNAEAVATTRHNASGTVRQTRPRHGVTVSAPQLVPVRDFCERTCASARINRVINLAAVASRGKSALPESIHYLFLVDEALHRGQ